MSRTVTEYQRAAELVQHLERFEHARRQGVSAAEYWLSLAEASRTLALLVDFLLIDLEAARWDIAALRAALAALRSNGGGIAYVRALIAEVYLDRIEAGDRPALEDFPDVSPDAASAAFRIADEPWALGDVVVDRFVVHQRLGRGSFGVVYAAFDRTTKSTVALKTPPLSVQDIGEARRLLEAEAQVTRELGPQVCLPMEKVSLDERGHPFVAMPIANGGSLRDRFRQGQLQVAEAARILGRAARAVSLAHRRAVIHRDLTPGNILLDQTGGVFITDFGLALIEDDRQTAMEGEVGGTFGYLPPDAILGATHQLDGRSDIWALGAVLYEALVGRPVAGGSDRESALPSAIVAATPRLRFPADVPDVIQEIVRGCLEPNPLHRFAAAADVAHLLESFTEGRRTNTPDRPGLVAWRCGKLLGTFQRYVALAEQFGIVTPAEQLRVVGFWFGAADAVSDLSRVLALPLFLPAEGRFPAAPKQAMATIRSSLYRRGKTSGLADAQGQLVQWVGAVLAEFQRFFADQSISQLSTLEFGLLCQAALVLPVQDYSVRDVARRTAIPVELWGCHLDGLLGDVPSAAKNVAFDRIDKAIERYFVFDIPS